MTSMNDGSRMTAASPVQLHLV